ncbi:MAG: EamA family transporter RarD [Sphingomonadaceae bacterium]
MDDAQRKAREGLFYGLGCYFLWGVFPLYFKALDHVPPIELVAHRIVWSLVFLAALIAFGRRFARLKGALATRRTPALLVLTALLIAVNWLTYIWAVVNDHVLEASLGYYLNPLVNVALGVVLLKEPLSRLQWLAVLLAGLGVAVLAAGAGEALWVTLTLAASFSLYGYFRKTAAVGALEGLSVETALLAPIAAGWLVWLQLGGQAALGRVDLATDMLLLVSGVATAVPLLLFTAAARRLRYTTLGFLQYLAPSLQFLLAVIVFGEMLTFAHIVCFAAIWLALALYSFERWRMGRARRMMGAAA